jgi:3-oxoacyl-ACP reductase-like protein
MPTPALSTGLVSKERPVSIFSAIMHKIFHHGGQQAQPQAAQPRPAAPQPAAPAAAPQAAAPQPAMPMQSVDVEAVLSEMAAHQGTQLNWRTSIGDLLKLLELDSSLQARKELAQELDVHVGADGSAEENIALHKAVMHKLAENGGKVPDSLRNA